MDFAALPPEINSGRMYAGPGPGSMLAAAAAWQELASELYSAAVSYDAVVAGLVTGPWLGPASASMAAAAATSVAWMISTAERTGQAAAQAGAAAAAFETAFAMTVAPPAIAANRSLLAALIATNVLGQNTPAIMATELDYMEMWAQDVAAMYGYAIASATAATMTPFAPPTPTTNSGGLAGQSAAVTEAVGSSAGQAQLSLSQLDTVVPTALQGLASPAGSTSGLDGLSNGLALLQAIEGPAQILAIGGGDVAIPPAASLGFTSGILLNAAAPAGLANAVASATAPAVTPPAAVLASTATPLGSAGIGGGVATANLGTATSIGALSVPQAWAPGIRLAGAGLPDVEMGGTPASNGPGPAGLLGGLPKSGASLRTKRGLNFGDGIRPLNVIPLRGYTG